MFDLNSRYRNQETYLQKDSRGRIIKVVFVPPQIQSPIRGYHRLVQGERLDHLADKYLDDPTTFWRIAEANDALWPDAIAEKPLITIPTE